MHLLAKYTYVGVSHRVPDRPIIFVGMPRSGTTLTFAAFAAHPCVGFFSQYGQRFPRLPALAALSRLADVWPQARRGVSRASESRPLVDRLRIAPSENYRMWEHCCGHKFTSTFLLDVEATEGETRSLHSKVATTLRLQGKERFAAKLTGPARIGYLSSAFKDALFVHIVRDPRAVVDSLMRVALWRDTFRYREPAWGGGLTAADIAEWHAADDSPVALAAIEWRAVLDRAREEAASLEPDRYTEVRYEDFLADPHAFLKSSFAFCQLPPASEPHKFVDDRLELKDLTQGWRDRLSPEDVRATESLTSPAMQELGYM